MAIPTFPAQGSTDWYSWASGVDAAGRQLQGREPLLHTRVQVDPDTWTMYAADLTTLTVPTPDGTGVVVHPSPLFFPDGWNGWRYWLAFTPYAGQSGTVENPSIAVSDDGITWQVPTGVTNPLVTTPPSGAYNSDAHLTVGPDGRMYIFYRAYGLGGGTTVTIRYIASSDGVTWSAPIDTVSAALATEDVVSPSVWWDGGAGQWVMLAVDPKQSPAVITRRTSATLGTTWAKTVSSYTPALPTGRRIWHMFATYIGGQVIALINENGGIDGAPGALYFLVSDDQGRTFRRAVNQFGGPTFPNMYRSTFIPTFKDDGLSVEVFLGDLSAFYKGPIVRRRDVFGDYARDVAAARLKTYPYLVGDTFIRANSTTGIGVADTGQAWTTYDGAPGIVGNEAYATTAANTKAVIDVGASDFYASVLTYGTTGQSWLMVRAADTANYLRFGVNSGECWWELISGGGVAAAMSPSVVIPPGTSIRRLLSVRAVGDLYQFYLDGRKISEMRSTVGQTNTRVGFQTDNTGTRFIGLTVRAPAVT